MTRPLRSVASRRVSLTVSTVAAHRPGRRRLVLDTAAGLAAPSAFEGMAFIVLGSRDRCSCAIDYMRD